MSAIATYKNWIAIFGTENSLFVRTSGEILYVAETLWNGP